jgi:hypothetical protein
MGVEGLNLPPKVDFGPITLHDVLHLLQIGKPFRRHVATGFFGGLLTG